MTKRKSDNGLRSQIIQYMMMCAHVKYIKLILESYFKFHSCNKI